MGLCGLRLCAALSMEPCDLVSVTGHIHLVPVIGHCDLVPVTGHFVIWHLSLDTLWLGTCHWTFYDMVPVSGHLVIWYLSLDTL